MHKKQSVSQSFPQTHPWLHGLGDLQSNIHAAGSSLHTVAGAEHCVSLGQQLVLLHCEGRHQSYGATRKTFGMMQRKLSNILG